MQCIYQNFVYFEQNILHLLRKRVFNKNRKFLTSLDSLCPF